MKLSPAEVLHSRLVAGAGAERGGGGGAGRGGGAGAGGCKFLK